MSENEKKETLKFNFKGQTFECVPKMVKNYRVQKAIANGENNPIGYYNALSLMFDGKDEEYSDMLGGDMADLMELYTAAVEAVAAKN